MEGKQFDPSRYLTKIGPADYLEVKWRLLWLRTEHPDAEIETELVAHGDDFAVFRARVSVPGRGAATGHGSESRADFREYLEKAETKAVGRALAALGFGTQFCADFEFASGSNKVVDSPIDFASTRGRKLAARNAGEAPANNAQATDRQISFIRSIARERGMDEEELNAELEQAYGKPVSELGRRDASAYIETLKSRRPPVELAS